VHKGNREKKRIKIRDQGGGGGGHNKQLPSDKRRLAAKGGSQDIKARVGRKMRGSPLRTLSRKTATEIQWGGKNVAGVIDKKVNNPPQCKVQIIRKGVIETGSGVTTPTFIKIPSKAKHRVGHEEKKGLRLRIGEREGARRSQGCLGYQRNDHRGAIRGNLRGPGWPPLESAIV